MCSRTFLVLFALMVAVGNIFSYVPIPASLYNDFTNQTVVNEWNSGEVPIPLAAQFFISSFWSQLIAFVMIPFVAAVVHKSLDKRGQTWYDSYKNTLFQRITMVLLYICLFGFAGHVAQLIFDQDCDVCTGFMGKTWPQGTELVATFFPSAFWIHAVSAGIISLLSPFQFTEKVREWNDFCAHRLIGRVVLCASCLHQAGATYMVVSNLFFNRHNVFPDNRPANLIYAMGFVPFNIYSWYNTILGWKYARECRIVEHGACMYRLACMWVVTVIVFRLFNPVLAFICGIMIGQKAGGEWGTAIHVPLAFLWTIPVEIFIRKSGRFDWSETGKGASARERYHPSGLPLEGSQCPFLMVE